LEVKITSITITAKTEAGIKAIQQHVDEYNKMPLRKKIGFKMFASQVITDNVLIITLSSYISQMIKLAQRSSQASASINVELAKAAMEIEKELKENGAEKEKDYKLEISI